MYTVMCFEKNFLSHLGECTYAPNRGERNDSSTVCRLLSQSTLVTTRIRNLLGTYTGICSNPGANDSRPVSVPRLELERSNSLIGHNILCLLSATVYLRLRHNKYIRRNSKRNWQHFFFFAKLNFWFTISRTDLENEEINVYTFRVKILKSF